MKNLKTMFIYKCNEKNNEYCIKLDKELDDNHEIIYAIWIYYKRLWKLHATETDYNTIVKYYKDIIKANLR